MKVFYNCPRQIGKSRWIAKIMVENAPSAIVVEPTYKQADYFKQNNPQVNPRRIFPLGAIDSGRLIGMRKLNCSILIFDEYTYMNKNLMKQWIAELTPKHIIYIGTNKKSDKFEWKLRNKNCW